MLESVLLSAPIQKKNNNFTLLLVLQRRHSNIAFHFLKKYETDH